MNWIDLLRMSSSNLKRRKLRTFLTVLGVVIGTASIVVMISLGLGMQKSIYDEIEQQGGLNTITVTGVESGQAGINQYGPAEETEESKKRITDEVVKELSKIEYVTAAEPVYNMSAILLKGPYEGFGELKAMTPKALKEKNIDVKPGGELPRNNASMLEVVYGNGIASMFYEKNSGKGYWETGKLPEVDLEKDTVFFILDQEAYFEQQNQPEGANAQNQVDGEGATPDSKARNSIQKYAVKSSGVVTGSVEEYGADYHSIYCDLDTLKKVLKKEFAGRVIPGQPKTKSGKPYKEFSYSSAQVKVDDIEKVEEVCTTIRQLGYNVSTNQEYMDSMKSQLAIIQAVLGGIGAVSLLVAAIGIANTMMMSIYERTKEIGVIKVLGCSLKNIKQMFLLEAAFIGFLGGMLGGVLSVLMSLVINLVTSNNPMTGGAGNISVIPLWLFLTALGFAVFVGMVAGYFPALRAMRLSPLAAIRND